MTEKLKKRELTKAEIRYKDRLNKSPEEQREAIKKWLEDDLKMVEKQPGKWVWPEDILQNNADGQ